MVYDVFDSLLKFVLRIFVYINCCIYVIETKPNNVLELYFSPLYVYFSI
jgi:hypothetical protein